MTNEINHANLKSGRIIHTGWTQKAEGVNVWDYFDQKGSYLGADEFGTAPTFEDGVVYRIDATYDDGGSRICCDRVYALGEYAHQIFSDKAEAEAIADDLRSDVGVVVDASVEYEVVEVL